MLLLLSADNNHSSSHLFTESQHPTDISSPNAPSKCQELNPDPFYRWGHGLREASPLSTSHSKEVVEAG